MDTQQMQSIPTEKGWPLLGVLPNFVGKDPYEYLKNIMLEHGGLVQLNIGTKPVYLVSHPDYMQRILRDNYQNYRKPDLFYNTAREVTGNGLIVSDGDLWLRQRRMIQPLVHRKQLASLFDDMVDPIAHGLATWKLLAENGSEVEYSKKLGEITINVVAHTMFGKGTLPDAEITEIGLRVMRMVQYTGKTLYSSMVPDWFPIPGKSTFLQDLNDTRSTIHHIIAKSRENKDSSASLIGMLINAVDEESHEQMTEQQLFDEVMTIFIAGYETTTTALTWLGIALHDNPKVLKKLQAEIDEVLGDRLPTFEDVSRLIYTRQVFMEVMRLHTVIPFLPRALNQADQLGEFSLPAEAIILLFYHGVHHNPSVWKNPEDFDPERFTPENMAGQHIFAYLPFSAGPRKCAGDEFAMLEGILMTAMMLQTYNINIIPNQIFAARLGGSRQPRHGVKATFSIRNTK